MTCTLAATSLKLFARVVHCLAKVGEEIYFEPQTGGLSLRTINTQRSGFAAVFLDASFFREYAFDFTGTMPAKLKLYTRPLQAVFRNVGSLERTADKCVIDFDYDNSACRFVLYQRHGVVKTYNFNYIECDSLQAVFSKDSCDYHLSASGRLLLDLLDNFYGGIDDISLILRDKKVTLKNFVETIQQPERTKVMHTELSLELDEFDSHAISENATDLTFSFKEFKAFLQLADNKMVTVHFNRPGKPVILSLDIDGGVSVCFTLATMSDPDRIATQQSSAASTQTRQPQAPVSTVSKRPREPLDDTVTEGERDVEKYLRTEETFEEMLLAELGALPLPTEEDVNMMLPAREPTPPPPPPPPPKPFEFLFARLAAEGVSNDTSQEVTEDDRPPAVYVLESQDV